jgi:hypothetical protein
MSDIMVTPVPTNEEIETGFDGVHAICDALPASPKKDNVLRMVKAAKSLAHEAREVAKPAPAPVGLG